MLKYKISLLVGPPKLSVSLLVFFRRDICSSSRVKFSMVLLIVINRLIGLEWDELPHVWLDMRHVERPALDNAIFFQSSVHV